MATTFSVICPCGCGTTVTAIDKGFKATTVSVECCEASLLGTVTTRKSLGYAMAIPETGLRHKDGLVVFG